MHCKDLKKISIKFTALKEVCDYSPLRRWENFAARADGVWVAKVVLLCFFVLFTHRRINTGGFVRIKSLKLS